MVVGGEGGGEVAGWRARGGVDDVFAGGLVTAWFLRLVERGDGRGGCCRKCKYSRSWYGRCGSCLVQVKGLQRIPNNNSFFQTPADHQPLCTLTTSHSSSAPRPSSTPPTMHTSPCEHRATSPETRQAPTPAFLHVSAMPTSTPTHPPSAALHPPPQRLFPRSVSVTPRLPIDLNPLTQHPRSSSRPRRHESATAAARVPQPHATGPQAGQGRVGAGTVTVVDMGTEERDGHLPDRRTVAVACGFSPPQDRCNTP